MCNVLGVRQDLVVVQRAQELTPAHMLRMLECDAL